MIEEANTTLDFQNKTEMLIQTEALLYGYIAEQHSSANKINTRIFLSIHKWDGCGQQQTLTSQINTHILLLYNWLTQYMMDLRSMDFNTNST